MLHTMSLRAKLRLINLITFMALFIIAIAGLTAKRQAMMDGVHHQLRDQMSIVFTLLDYYRDQVGSGKLGESEAKTQALDTLRKLRYQDKEFFSVSDMQPVMLMHPTAPQLEGKNFGAMKDKNGKEFIAEMLGNVKKQGYSYTEYWFPKAGENAPSPKLAYARLYEPWGWMVNTGMYIDNVNRQFWETTTWFVGLILLAGGLVALLSNWLGYQIVTAVQSILDAVKKAEHDRDLTQTFEVGRQDEIGTLGRGFSSLMQAMCQTLQNLGERAHRLDAMANDVAQDSRSVAQSAQEQTDAAQSAASALEEVSVSVSHVADRTSEIARLADKNRMDTERGRQCLSELVEKVGRVEKVLLGDIAESVAAFSQNMAQISQITGYVKEIADQTNLLALNAAIEAARAGETGRGFAVVADEVRKLAEKSAQSANQIESITRKLNDHSRTVQVNIDSGKGLLLQSNEAVSAVVGVLNEARATAEETNSGIVEINQSLGEQRSALDELARHTQIVSEMAERNLEVVRHSSGVAHDLEALSGELVGMMQQYRYQ